MRSLKHGASLPLALAASLAVSQAATAETLTYGADAGIAETDNVNLAPTREVSQTIAVVDLDFDVKQLTRRFDLDAKGNFSYLDYLQNAYGGQLVGRFDGTAKIALIPERLTWVVQDDFGQAALDPFTPQTPNNLENVNYLSTGPDVALRFGGTTFLNLSARVARAQYETSPFNSNRVLGDAAWGFQLSPASTLSLNADTERVLFENTVFNTDFDRSNAFMRYEIQGARTTFSADLGGTRIEQGGVSSFRITGAAAVIAQSVRGRDADVYRGPRPHRRQHQFLEPPRRRHRHRRHRAGLSDIRHLYGQLCLGRMEIRSQSNHCRRDRPMGEGCLPGCPSVRRYQGWSRIQRRAEDDSRADGAAAGSVLQVELSSCRATAGRGCGRAKRVWCYDGRSDRRIGV